MNTQRSLIPIFLILSLALPLGAEKDSKPGKSAAANATRVLWRDPGDVRSLNLFYGPGGKEHAPNPNATYTFVKEDMEGSSPKFDVKDSDGVHWRVKLGREPRSETAATRLLWAAGYFVDQDYFLPTIKVDGLTVLRRGNEWVSPDGTVRRARLERRDRGKKLGNWGWFDNPFRGTREMNGLRVMMALLNNWDLKTINNSIYEVDGEQHFAVSDLGATFGKTGNNFTRSRDVLADYQASHFIHKTRAQTVDFVMHSRPFFFGIFNFPNYLTRTRMEQVTRDIPRADARWVGERLARLSDDQLRDCFRSSGYSPQEVEGFTRVVRQRITELAAL